MQCYRLVGNGRDKVIAYAKGMAAETIALGLFWYAFVYFHHPVTLALCALVLLVGPLILVDALTMSICVMDKGISRVSAVSRRGEREPWIDWEHLVSVDVQSNSRCASGIEKVVINGRHEVHGLGGAYWQPRRVVIPGHLPDIQRILALMRDHARDKFVGQTDANG